MLPRPDPLTELQGSGLSDREQRKLADVRRFVDPTEQELIERSVLDLVRDERLPRTDVIEALRRALSGLNAPAGFCARLARELSSLRLAGAEVSPPEAVAVVASIDMVFGSWLSSAGRARYADPAKLARAIRDGTLERDALDEGFALGGEGGVLFVTDARALDGSAASAAGLVCLTGPPAASFVVALVPSTALVAPLRVPTAADGVCRPKFVLPAPDATAGVTCAGAPEFVTRPVPLGAVSELRLSR